VALSEFDLIKQFFTASTPSRDDVVLGIGDDCAILSCPPDKALVVSIDTLVEGVHFFADVDPKKLGHKVLAVSLSDLAAMGAEPAWFTLALTLPNVDIDWLSAFSQGMARLAKQFNIELIGGDTTKGPLTISVQVHGFVEKGQALRRDDAQVGDVICVTGTLGDAGAGLALYKTDLKGVKEQDAVYLKERLECPTPRIDIAKTIRSVAHSAIDISDGLLADLGHILKRSGVGAELNIDSLPLSPEISSIPKEQALSYALTAGDDYELCFTLSEKDFLRLVEQGQSITKIGRIVEGRAVSLLNQHGEVVQLPNINGYQHFE
jgi:thiamine-monophosphate kinase